MSRPPNPEPATTPEAGKDARGDAGLGRTIGRVMSIGLCVAVVLLVVGGILALAGRGPCLRCATSVGDLPRALAALEPGGLLDLGLLALLATPVATVAALVVGFARRRSWLFCGLSVFVLAVFALSTYLGLRD